MRKIVAVSILVMICTVGLFSQEERTPINEEVNRIQPTGRINIFIGIKGSFGFANIFEKTDTVPVEYSTLFTGGFGVRFSCFNKYFGFISEVEWVRMGAIADISGINYDDKIKLDYVYLNSMFSIKLSFFYFGFGLFLGFLMKAEATREYESGSTESVNVKSNFNKVDFGYIFTIGGQWKFNAIKFFAGLDFRMSLVKTNETNSNDLKIRNYSLLLNIGFGI